MAHGPSAPDIFDSVRLPENIGKQKAPRRFRGMGKQSLRKIENQKNLIEAVASGQSLMDARKRLRINNGTYRSWRSQDKVFAVQMDQAKLAAKELKGEIGPEDLFAADVVVSDFAKFRKKYFGYETWPYQKQIVDRLDNPVKMRTISLVLVHPESGKTTLIVDWICYKLATEPNHRFLVISASQKHARKMIGQVKRRMTDRLMSRGIASYIETFGPFHEEGQSDSSKPWAADYISVAKSSRDEKEFSLEAVGMGGQIYGARCDTAVCDDIQTKKNLNLAESMLDTFRQEIISRPSIRGGRVVVVGTRVAPGDVYEKMMDENVISDSGLVRLPARLGDGTPLEANMYNDDELTEIEKQSGPVAWATAYMLTPSAGTHASFTEQMVTDSLSDIWTCNNRPSVPVVMSLDPALGGGNVLMVAAWTQHLLAFYDEQVDYKLSRNEQIYARIDEMAARHRPNILIIEAASLQKGLARDDRLKALGAKHGFRIIEHQTTHAKTDPTLGVAMMPSSFIRGEIAIANGDELTKVRMTELRLQLMAWRPYVPTRQLKQDAVMAAWFIWKWWMENRNRNSDDADAFDGQALPWNPTDVGERQLSAAGGGW